MGKEFVEEVELPGSNQVQVVLGAIASAVLLAEEAKKGGLPNGDWLKRLLLLGLIKAHRKGFHDFEKLQQKFKKVDLLHSLRRLASEANERSAPFEQKLHLLVWAMQRLPGPPAVLATLVPADTFSFLSSAAAVSNLGLHDQPVGLRWIAENIGHFGGNKDSVALPELRLIIDSMFC